MPVPAIVGVAALATFVGNLIVTLIEKVLINKAYKLLMLALFTSLFVGVGFYAYGYISDELDRFASMNFPGLLTFWYAISPENLNVVVPIIFGAEITAWSYSKLEALVKMQASIAGG